MNTKSNSPRFFFSPKINIRNSAGSTILRPHIKLFFEIVELRRLCFFVKHKLNNADYKKAQGRTRGTCCTC